MRNNVTALSSYTGAGLLTHKLISPDQLLERLDAEVVEKLTKHAADGQTLIELAKHLGVSYASLVKARMQNEQFDEYCRVLETIAASKHMESARRGVRDPKGFSPAAFDRVMGALGYTPHVENVSLQVTAADGTQSSTTTISRHRVGFDVQDFIAKHRASASEHQEHSEHSEPIDVEGEVVDDADEIL